MHELESLLSSAEANLPQFERSIRTLVEHESPTEAPALVNAAADVVQAIAKSLNPRVKIYKQSGYGNLLELRFGPVGGRHAPVLLLGHLDTVWPVGTIAHMPFRSDTESIYGPGVFDMKGGILLALTALFVLQERDEFPAATLLLVSDEEVGSPISRPITEAIAREHRAVFVLEPPQGLALKTARKGIANYTLSVAGVAAHSGIDFDRGHSAIRELAHQVEIVSSLSGLRPGLTVNVGTIQGGTRSNVVAAAASAHVEVRVCREGDATWVEDRLRHLKVTDSACTLSLVGGLNRPPMERGSGTAALFRQAQSFAIGMGFSLAEASSGGGSDGNFTSALGIPTLDGMGAPGEGAHADHECIFREHLAQRIALLAAMIAHDP